MDVAPHKTWSLLDRSIIGMLLFFILLLVGVQFGKAADRVPTAQTASSSELSPPIHR